MIIIMNTILEPRLVFIDTIKLNMNLRIWNLESVENSNDMTNCQLNLYTMHCSKIIILKKCYLSNILITISNRTSERTLSNVSQIIKFSGKAIDFASVKSYSMKCKV